MAETTTADTAPARFDIDSKSTGRCLRITVAEGEPGAPVVYVLDPLFLFGIAAGAAGLLRAASRLTDGAFPSLTIVGVGYPAADPAEVFALRAWDLTPTDGRANPAIGLPPLIFGGADRFLAALVDEVVATVEARYQVDARRRALAGFSFGGLFGLYCLFHRPEAFAGYLCGSPSLWWDDGIVFAWEEAWARGHPDLHARVFLSVGANEQTVGDTWKNERLPLRVLQQLKQVDNLNDLVTRLKDRDYPGLVVATAVFDSEYHLTAPAAAITRGLLTIFDDERL